MQVGAKATTEMKNLDALEKKKTVTVMVGFLESCTKYLLNNLPLDNNIIKIALTPRKSAPELCFKKCIIPDTSSHQSSW